MCFWVVKQGFLGVFLGGLAPLIEMYSGTTIPSGITLDITNLEFFGIINIARAYFHLSLKPFVVECHLYIDPFGFYLGGAVQVSPGMNVLGFSSALEVKT